MHPIFQVFCNNNNGMHQVSTFYKSSKETVAYLGHTVQVEYDPGSIVVFDGKPYDFKQFHFHTPSEHHVDGITYPLEMHMVHTCAHRETDTDKPQYLVISILFKEGEENEFLNEFLSEIPTTEGEVFELPDKFVDVDDLLDHRVDNFYYYLGSLTTPPFTESVNWSILKKIYEASPEQIRKINLLEGNNARHIQAIYGRKIDG
ncbi:MAG: carbonic anhydrase family protein, partial [Bacteroidota bacterium]